MTLTELNNLPRPELEAALRTCCGAEAWVRGVADGAPFAYDETLYERAQAIWYGLAEPDWREAFTHHPKIGQDVNSLREKFASTAQWASGEQGAVQRASEETLQALARGNEEYEAKFGYIFIVCATGKTADEMLALLQERLPNPPEDEIHIATIEQARITQLRLEKLLSA